jgi:predicted transcriptional regulator
MSTTVKEAVLDIAKKLPDDCSWEDVMYQMYVRQKIQAGLDDAENGRVVSDEEVFAEFGQ